MKQDDVKKTSKQRVTALADGIGAALLVIGIVVLVYIFLICVKRSIRRTSEGESSVPSPSDRKERFNNQPPRQESEIFEDAISKTLKAGGNLLPPMDTAGCVLELILILEDYWAEHFLNYPIFFLTYVSSSTIDYVESFLEWMGDSITKSFETSHDNAFLLRHVNFLINKSELDNATEGQKVVLASMASLKAGFSHDIFVEWTSDVKNLVFFIERGQFGTLA